jgi:hypothetical protein
MKDNTSLIKTKDDDNKIAKALWELNKEGTLKNLSKESDNFVNDTISEVDSVNELLEVVKDFYKIEDFDELKTKTDIGINKIIQMTNLLALAQLVEPLDKESAELIISIAKNIMYLRISKGREGRKELVTILKSVYGYNPQDENIQKRGIFGRRNR